jgi:hypothetical protein
VGGGGGLAAPPHLLGEAQQVVRLAVGGRVGHERPAARDAIDQPLLGQPLDRVASGHPAHRELAAEHRVRRQRIARRQGRDPLAQRLLDHEVARCEAGLHNRMLPV